MLCAGERCRGVAALLWSGDTTSPSARADGCSEPRRGCSDWVANECKGWLAVAEPRDERRLVGGGEAAAAAAETELAPTPAAALSGGANTYPLPLRLSSPEPWRRRDARRDRGGLDPAPSEAPEAAPAPAVIIIIMPPAAPPSIAAASSAEARLEVGLLPGLEAEGERPPGPPRAAGVTELLQMGAREPSGVSAPEERRLGLAAAAEPCDWRTSPA